MINRLIKTSLLTGVPFGLFMGLFFMVLHGILIGLISGITCGVLFGLIIAGFVEFQRKRMSSKDGKFEGEIVLFEDGANHFLNGEGRGGWLTLTPSRLAFRSHGLNTNNQAIDINITEIVEIIPTQTAGLIPNGLGVVLKTGQKESFVVNNRRKWLSVISQQIAAY